MAMHKALRPGPLLLAAVGTALACVLVLAVLALTGGNGTSAIAAVASAVLPVRDPAGLRVRGSRPYKCLECGVIVSTREITPNAPGAANAVPARASGVPATPGTRGVRGVRGVHGAESGQSNAAKSRVFEITIRLQDGSRQVITDANSATWRHGDRVTLIAGTP